MASSRQGNTYAAGGRQSKYPKREGGGMGARRCHTATRLRLQAYRKVTRALQLFRNASSKCDRSTSEAPREAGQGRAREGRAGSPDSHGPWATTQAAPTQQRAASSTVCSGAGSNCSGSDVSVNVGSDKCQSVVALLIGHVAFATCL